MIIGEVIGFDFISVQLDNLDVISFIPYDDISVAFILTPF